MKIIEDMEAKSAFEFVSPVFRTALENQLRLDGTLTEAQIKSHIIEKCEQVKAIEIAEKKKQFGLDIEENPELIAERARDKMIEVAKRLNKVIS